MADKQENKENLEANVEKQTEVKTELESEDTKKEEEKAAIKSIGTEIRKSILSVVSKTSRLRMRKHSIGMSSVMGIKKLETLSRLEFRRPVTSFEPTYQLEPITKFDCNKVENFVNTVLDSTYEGHQYNVDESPALAVKLANTIMREVKYMLFNRYRILSIVAIGQKRAQSYYNTISFIWDPIRDAYVDVHRENITTFIQVTIFGIYLD